MNYLRIRKNILHLLCLLFCISLVLPLEANTAEITLSSNIKNIKVGDQFEVNFFLNAKDENINAVEGVVIFPQNLLKIKEIKNGNSIISFWSKLPQASGNRINFSGAVPGGYAGRSGLIFSGIFEVLAEGVGNIEVANAMALRNDGKGTPVDVTISGLRLSVADTAVSPQAPVEDKDIYLPEEFTPAISQDETIFDGQYFLVFATQDKGSGIDYYEVCEGKTECVRAESLYLLKNQSLNEEITVYAVDKSGNKRMAKLSPEKPTPWYTKPQYLAIISVLLAYLIWRVWKKRSK